MFQPTTIGGSGGPVREEPEPEPTPGARAIVTPQVGDGGLAGLREMRGWLEAGWALAPQERRRICEDLLAAMRISMREGRLRMAKSIAETLRRMHADNLEREVYEREQGLMRASASASEQGAQGAQVQTRRKIIIEYEQVERLGRDNGVVGPVDNDATNGDTLRHGNGSPP